MNRPKKDKEIKERYTLHIPLKLREVYEAKAKKLDRSLNWVMIETLEKYKNK